MTGALLVLEGAEGVGKTTQARLLAATLSRGARETHVLREPGGTQLGETVRALLLDPSTRAAPEAEVLLFLASRAELVARVVQPALARGDIVILDRFFLSTYAYQVAGRGLAEEPVRSANSLATGGLVPDITIVLSLPDDAGLARAAGRGPADRMELSDSAFHARVRAAFHECTRDAWQRAHPECGPIVEVDGSGAEGVVAARVVSAIATHVPALAPVLGAAHGVVEVRT